MSRLAAASMIPNPQPAPTASTEAFQHASEQMNVANRTQADLLQSAMAQHGAGARAMAQQVGESAQNAAGMIAARRAQDRKADLELRLQAQQDEAASDRLQQQLQSQSTQRHLDRDHEEKMFTKQQEIMKPYRDEMVATQKAQREGAQRKEELLKKTTFLLPQLDEAKRLYLDPFTPAPEREVLMTQMMNINDQLSSVADVVTNAELQQTLAAERARIMSQTRSQKNDEVFAQHSDEMSKRIENDLKTINELTDSFEVAYSMGRPVEATITRAFGDGMSPDEAAVRILQQLSDSDPSGSIVGLMIQGYSVARQGDGKALEQLVERGGPIPQLIAGRNAMHNSLDDQFKALAGTLNPDEQAYATVVYNDLKFRLRTLEATGFHRALDQSKQADALRRHMHALKNSGDYIPTVEDLMKMVGDVDVSEMPKANFEKFETTFSPLPTGPVPILQPVSASQASPQPEGGERGERTIGEAASRVGAAVGGAAMLPVRGFETLKRLAPLPEMGQERFKKKPKRNLQIRKVFESKAHD